MQHTCKNITSVDYNQKTLYLIAQRLFAMRRYGGGMLYAALPLHMQRGCFRIQTHDQQVTKAQLYPCIWSLSVDYNQSENKYLVYPSNESKSKQELPMGDQDEASATSEHVVPIPLAVSNIANVHPDLDKRARYNYCGCLIKYENGTSAMHAHLKRCKDNLDKDGNKRQKSALSSTAIVEANVSSSPSYAKFDQEACHNELVKMFVVIGLPFYFVENEIFRKFLSLLQPRFSVPSRIALVRHILTLWDTERTNLKKFLSEHYQRVCLTIDMWSSSQVTSHSVEVMAKTVELCMNGWGLSGVFSATVDNALPNDVGIQYLKNKLMSWNNLVLKGDYIHMRCCTLVKEGLEDIDGSISRIRAAVKYIRSSPSRLSKFKACIEKKKIEYKPICLDFENRWDSTYLMLEAALMNQEAFVELQNKKYDDELRKGEGVPTYEDWDNARLILPFLNIFYKATLRISSPSDVTGNIYMLEVFGIGKRICQMCESKDKSINMMAKRLRKIYD
ncbi:Zinc finger BED domain-containing protein RICESLEEPER 2 [Glycine max]|nr:Zinc finger BED domain-containing protein RICESLEEPER 2 [Glycine max]